MAAGLHSECLARCSQWPDALSDQIFAANLHHFYDVLRSWRWFGGTGNIATFYPVLLAIVPLAELRALRKEKSFLGRFFLTHLGDRLGGRPVAQFGHSLGWGWASWLSHPKASFIVGMMFPKILVAIDQSEISKRVFQTALVFARATQAELMLAQVLSLYSASVELVPNGVYPSSVDAIGLYVEQVKTMKDQGLRRLRQYRDRADIAGVETQYRQTLGEPGREICRLADSWGASLIIVERQYGSLATERPVSSMCNYVIRHAPAAVLMV